MIFQLSCVFALSGLLLLLFQTVLLTLILYIIFFFVWDANAAAQLKKFIRKSSFPIPRLFYIVADHKILAHDISTGALGFDQASSNSFADTELSSGITWT